MDPREQALRDAWIVKSIMERFKEFKVEGEEEEDEVHEEALYGLRHPGGRVVSDGGGVDAGVGVVL